MKILRLLLPLALLSGCVTQSTYDALMREHEGTQSELEERNQALAEAQKKHDALLARS